MTEFKDKAGVYIFKGDLIVYGHNLGRCAGLRYGKVLDIIVKRADWRCETDTVKLKVRGVDDDWDSREAELLSRVSYLQFNGRVLRVSREQVPGHIVNLLDAVEV